MNPRKFFSELKRRNVYKVAVAYIVAGWALSQGIAQVFPVFDIPNWVIRLIVLLIVIGLPIALVFAWMFELTPQGIKRTEDVDPPAAASAPKKHAWIYVVVIGGLLSIGLFFLGRYSARNNTGAVGELSAKSIAVLPFDNLSRDPDNAFFAEGVQDEILTRLAKVADLKVISRTSTQRFKSAPENLPQIAKQLGVMNILEGSVQKFNEQVRVNVQLINAMTDAHLWAETYDRKLTDMFSVESEIAKTVADTLQVKLSGREMSEMSVRPTEDPVAHELLVKGRYFLGLRRGDNLPRAIEFFQQVIARDPSYAAAYGGLSEAYVVLPRYTAAYPKDAFPKAKAAALKALELNPNLAEAHNALAKLAYDVDLDFAESNREFRRAIELNPNYAGAHHWFSGASLEALGNFDEAIAEGKRGVELDPLSVVNLADLGRIYFAARRFKDATVVFEKSIELDPDSSYAHWHFGEMLQVSGDLKRAAAEFTKAGEEKGHPVPIALIGQLQAKMGRPEEARKALKELGELSKQRPVDTYWFALLYIALGDKEQALRSLEQSYADREGYNIGPIKVDPMLDSLRGDPRFEALVKKVIGPREGAKR